MVKGDTGNHLALKGGDASRPGGLKTLYDGPRPSPDYKVMKKQGAIILGIGGDNSDCASIYCAQGPCYQSNCCSQCCWQGRWALSTRAL
jgi:hypothetical protein